jgi:N-acetylglutamate synthase-like GNAT family acetyltransferase
LGVLTCRVMHRINEKVELEGESFQVREAQAKDVSKIHELFLLVYNRRYPLAMDLNVLQAEIADGDHYIWIVADDGKTGDLAGAVMFSIDTQNRMGKATGAVVHPDKRSKGLGSHLLKTGVSYLTNQQNLTDVIYATTRTVSEGPSRMVNEVGFKKLGLFPNAVQIETMEHLNLDIYLTPKALERRLKKPYLFGAFYEVYNIARKQLGLERAYMVTERAPLKLSPKKINFTVIKDEKEVVPKFRYYNENQRLSNSFFPFHMPNWILSGDDGATEVFVWYGGVGKHASIMGYRTDRVNIHDLLDSVALEMQNQGAAYIELLVDAYDYMLQQGAYTARYIPSAYFPAMKLAIDGYRDDFFVLSRTFRLLDFTGSYLSQENYPFLQTYLRCYYNLYIQPVLGANTGITDKGRGLYEVQL